MNLLIFQTLTSKLFESSTQRRSCRHFVNNRAMLDPEEGQFCLTEILGIKIYLSCSISLSFRSMLDNSLSTEEETVCSLANQITALVKKRWQSVFFQLDSANSNPVIPLDLSSVLHYRIFRTLVISNYFSFPLRIQISEVQMQLVQKHTSEKWGRSRRAEDAMSKQQKPETRGNELRNHIREQCFSFVFTFCSEQASY